MDSGLRLAQGKIAATNACGHLQCKKVIHAHIPLRDDLMKTSASPNNLVEKIVTACLQKTEEDGMHSISFPAFGTGAAGYSVEEIAKPMLSALSSFGKGNPKSVSEVRIVILDQDQYDRFYTCFCEFFNKDPSTAVQGGSGPFHSLKTFFGFGSTDKGTSIELQVPKHSVGSTRDPSVWSIRPSMLANPVAVFTIYAASVQTADQIASELRKNMKTRVSEEEVQEEGVAFLLEDDIQDIQELGDQLGVKINVLPRMKKIAISGECSRVGKAKDKVTHMMREIERAKSELQTFEWQTIDGEEYEPYPEEAAIKLERASWKNIKYVHMAIDGIDVLIDLDNEQETEKATGNIRKVKRVKKTQAIGM